MDQATEQPKTELATVDQFIDSQLTRFEFRKEDLQKLVDSFADLKIDGINDKAGYDAVHDARMVLKGTRVQINKVVKDLKDMANDFKEAAVERGDEFVGIVSPRENELLKMETGVDDEKKRIKQLEIEEENNRIQTRINQLAAVGQVADYVTIRGYSDEQFEMELTDAINAHNAKLNKERDEREAKRIQDEKDEAIRLENKRIADQLRKEEEEKNRIERERLAKIQEEQIRKEQELYEREQAVEKERQAMREAQFKREQEQFKKEQVAQQMREAIERDAREKADEKERLRLQAIEDKRIAKEVEEERLKSATDPEKFAKLHEILSDCRNSPIVPIFTSRHGKAEAGRVWGLLSEAIEICRVEMTKDMDLNRS